MIKNKINLKEYLCEDKRALGIKKKCVPIFGLGIWKFERSLRCFECYLNVKIKIGEVLCECFGAM